MSPPSRRTTRRSGRARRGGRPSSFSRRSAIRRVACGHSHEAHKLDPQMAVDIERASDIVGARIEPAATGHDADAGFRPAAVALAAVGIYGVIAYGAAQRRNEVAIRLALGATPRQVFWLMLSTGGRWRSSAPRSGCVMAYIVRAHRLEPAVRSPRLRPDDPRRRDDRRRRHRAGGDHGAGVSRRAHRPVADAPAGITQAHHHVRAVRVDLARASEEQEPID